MKKLIAMILAAVMVLAMASAAPAAKAEEATYTIGICQLVQHAALDAAAPPCIRMQPGFRRPSDQMQAFRWDFPC